MIIPPLEVENVDMNYNSDRLGLNHLSIGCPPYVVGHSL